MTLKKEDFLWILRYSSLLHDIGKFRQRCETVRRIEQQKAGLGFIRKVNFPPEVEKFKDEIAKLVGSHHREKEPPVEPPEGEVKRLRDVLIEADTLSATEREPMGAEGELVISKVPLRSIFFEIKLGSEAKAEERYYNVSPLMEFGEETILPPIDKSNMPETLIPQYEKSWVNFEKEVGEIAEIKDIQSHFSTLYYLLMKYTSFIPSAVYHSEPSIPLFDHLSTTCAIAESIYKSEDGKTLMLIGGDIGGIQNFIYTITSENASKMLRGRSFFIQLVNIITSRYILDKLKLPDPCLIFCGGGNFTILAPWTKKLEERLKESIRDINLWLLEELNGEISLAVGLTKVGKNELRNYGKLLQKLWDEVEGAKLKPFIEAPYKEVFEGAFEEAGHGKIRCKVCKKVLDKAELDAEGKSKYRIDDTEVCKLCKNLEKIGSSLPNTEYLTVISFKRELNEYELLQIACEPYMFAKKLRTLIELHPNVNILAARLKALCESCLRGELERIRIIRLNSADFQAEILLKHLGCELPVSFSFIPIA
ncbi:MAG: type III-A CRISPR-associated protein Cas10/Csm1, partial [Candidatus Baldrarchaeia archaeon]